MDELDLTMAQWVSLSIDQTFDGVKLVHDYEIGVVVLVVDGVDVWLQKLVIKLVVASLLKFQILNSATNLEQVFYDIFTLTAIFPGFRIDHKPFLVFSKQIAETHSVVIHSFIIKEMELFKDVDEVYLTGRGDILLNDCAILLIKALNDLSFS